MPDKESITVDDLVLAVVRGERSVKDRGYLSVVKCPCGWRGPFMAMGAPRTYPGRARCPECLSEQWSTEPLR